MRSAQNSFLLRGLCCGTSSYKSSSSKGEDRDLVPTSMSPKIMRPNSADTGLISGSNIEMARKDFANLDSEDSRNSTNLQVTAANLDKNKDLNRWCNVLPYDATRVKLLPIVNKATREIQSGNGSGNGNTTIPQTTCPPGFSDLPTVLYNTGNNSLGNNGEFNDYINASRIDAPYLENKSYILSQGPLPETIPHFWTMVWQQQVSAIVMLCRLTESGICKCARYWPATVEEDDLIEVREAGLEVRLRDFDDQDNDFSVRNLELRHCESDSIRVITQYHYLTWPDFGVPHSTSTFLKFLHAVSSKHPSTSDSPNIIHCSAGIGRSGTFILADTCLARMKQTQKSMTRSQIIDSLARMRTMRCGLIQTWEQLRFCLQSIEDGMLDIEFSDTEHESSGVVGGGGASEANGGINKTIFCRKRSTEIDESELRGKGLSNAGNNHEKTTTNNDDGANSAGALPKKPKSC